MCVVDFIIRVIVLNMKFRVLDSFGVINCINIYVIYYVICNVNNIYKMIFEFLKKFNFDSYVLFCFFILEM